MGKWYLSYFLLTYSAVLKIVLLVTQEVDGIWRNTKRLLNFGGVHEKIDDI